MSTGLRLLLGGLLVMLVGAVTNFLVTAGLLPTDVPVPAVTVLASVGMVLVVGVGCHLLGRRVAAETPLDHVLGLLGPVLLGAAMFVGSRAEWWFPVLVLLAITAAGFLGLRQGSDQPVLTTSQRGAGSLEVVGVVTVAAVLVAAVTATVAASDPHVRDTIWAQICKITGGECSAGEAPSHADYRPDRCEVATAGTTVTGVVDVAIVRLGGEKAVQRTEFNDGAVEITMLNEGRGGVQVSAGARGELTYGETTAGFSAEAEAALTGGLGVGETYSFDSREQADEFQGYLEREMGEDVAGSLNPIYGGVNNFVEWATGEEAPPNNGVQKTTVRADVTGEASAEVSGLGASAGGEGSAMVALGTEFDRGELVDDPADNTRTDFFEANIAGSFDAGAGPIYSVGGGGEASGVVKVTRDAAGEPIQVELISRTTGHLEAGGSLTGNPGSGAGDAADGATGGNALEKIGLSVDGQGNNSVVTRNILDLDTPERQAAFDDWFSFANGGDPSADTRGMAELLAEESKVSVMEYEGETFGLGAALEASLGLKLGFDVGGETSSTEAVAAHYLGAPDESGQRQAYDLPECY